MTTKITIPDWLGLPESTKAALEQLDIDSYLSTKPISSNDKLYHKLTVNGDLV